MGLISDLGTAEAEVEVACAAINTMRETVFSRLPDQDLLTLARSVERAARLVYAAQVELAGELDVRGAGAAFGCTSSAALLRQTLALSAGDARARVNTARAVLPRPAISGGDTEPVLPLLGRAIGEGGIGVEQTRIILATMRNLPGSLDPELRRECQQVLVEQGRVTEPEPLATLARRILLTCHPDGDYDDREHAEKVDLTVGNRNPVTGMTTFRGHLDDLGVELLGQAIGGLARPRPATDGDPDTRTAAVRRGQALKDVLHRYLNLGDAPVNGGERPHITLTMSVQDLTNTVGYGTLDHGGPVSPAIARRLACDATVIPAVLGSNSEVLDIGRATRVWPAGIRRAITLRDKGCAWFSCDRPAAWCDIHHRLHWANGGPTNYHNGALFCGHHHAILHDGHWQLRFAPDGTPEIIPPAWIDPTQTPRRNTYHHINDKLRT